MEEAKSIVWTNVVYEGFVLSVTSRDGGDPTPSFVEIIKFLNEQEVTPYHQYYNRYNELQDVPVNKTTDSVTNALMHPSPNTLVQQAKELGGVETPVLDEYVLTDEGVADILAGISEDGTNYLGVKAQKPKVADCKQGDSYEIYVDAYKRPEKDKIEFYNEHSKFPACTHSLKGAGGKLFQELFPGWEPAVGSGGKLKPLLLYIVGENETREGNAYQNLKGAKQA